MTWPFENDTSIVEKKLANRSMKADRRRSVFIILTIALAVCLMGTFCFIYSAQQKKTLDNILGQYQAGCDGLTREEVTRLVDTGRFEKWGYTADAGSVRYEDSVLNVSFVSPEMMDLMGYGKIAGAYPQAENEICIERSFFGYFNLPEEIGQTVTLNLGGGEKLYTVTGILESENSSRIFTVWIPEIAVDTGIHQAPYELRFRFEGSQVMEPEKLRADIERFFIEMGIPADRTFYSSSYFGMVDLYLGSGMEIYVLSALIAVPGYWSWRDNIRSAVVILFLIYGMVLAATRKPLSMAGKVSAIEAVRTTAYSGYQGRSISGQLHRRLSITRLALMNFSRNRKKAFVTALSLSLTGILLLCISTYANSVDVEEMAQSQFGDRSQYLLQYEDYAGREFYEMQKDNPLGQDRQKSLPLF